MTKNSVIKLTKPAIKFTLEPLLSIKMDVQEIQAVVLNILAFVLLLITLQPPLHDGAFPLQQRLFPDFHGCTFYGRDVFSLISGQAWLFWRILARHRARFRG